MSKSESGQSSKTEMSKSKSIETAIETHLEANKVPEKYKKSTKKLMTAMMNHEAYGNASYKWSLDDFELGERLGRGKFGRVFSAREKKTGYIVALKTILKSEVVKGEVERQIMREIEIQTHLKHPNVLQLLTWFHDDFRIYLVLEFAGQGELYNHLRNSPGGRFPERLSAKYTYQVADALDYCHKNEVIHRDIKPENLLLTIQGDIKLGDFGWSVHAPSMRRKTMCGTLDYLAPEMVHRSPHGAEVDNWCLGVLCYEFCVGSPPFETKSSEETYKKITNLEMTFPEFMPAGAIDLIKKLLVLNPKDRMPLSAVKHHPWIAKFVHDD